MSDMQLPAPRYRATKFGVTRITVSDGAPGVRYLQADLALGAYARRITDFLVHWAETTPDQTFLARRQQMPDGTTGEWQHISYAQALASARSIGQALLDRGLSPERPVVILSENSLEHAMMALGCLYAGVPYCPVSPAYATVSQDYEKLRHVMDTLTPGLVFVADATRYGAGVAATVGPDVEVVAALGQLQSREATSYASLLATPATPAIDAAMHATGPGTIVKFLFTSGSTKLPKPVINTQRMWCANLQQISLSLPVFAEAPPVLVDWLPWNHTFGGNHNFGLTLQHGGTLYIDDGKPTAALIGETLRNLREIAPTVYFNVPTGFEMIASAMESDSALRTTLLSRLKVFFYSGAGLSQPVWDKLHAIQESAIGERIVMATGLGMTESSPSAMFVNSPDVASGDIGVPVPGMTLKLVDVDGKTEVRYRGPNVTPGYWRSDAATRDAFDEEGYLCTGDAVKWISEADIHRGLRFDGRIAEDFKLSTGTFVSVGPMRAKIVVSGAPYIQDAVITGLNRKEVGALLFLSAACRDVANLPAEAPWADVVQSAPVRQRIEAIVDQLAREATGSASRVARVLLMVEPPSAVKGEITDKGSLNQRAVLKHRHALVEGLHDDTLPFIIKPTV
ncbi:Long-chain-fatty-acid--CoA ligase FadD15 [Curvibacter sp. AEP1-3]|uniref:feruloyl-CoA synthase n=1 Tax=Curvibacter sp. AEP1-3 TaxID=1844971 RepID=UPI000B3CCC04|nr:feruloyl-CoA synthase [Curvibacter sp. AEP1-3]ARV19084.1 Long-chain-fatty-acid--CoA ligase FadD15 [Curvibacter sp. AEP1-3]